LDFGAQPDLFFTKHCWSRHGMLCFVSNFLPAVCSTGGNLDFCLIDRVDQSEKLTATVGHCIHVDLPLNKLVTVIVFHDGQKNLIDLLDFRNSDKL